MKIRERRSTERTSHLTQGNFTGQILVIHIWRDADLQMAYFSLQT